ncbi:TRAM domain-containing protein, partial [uncultured Amaricoccus sp.]|uniref:TRAM domain-containing protein n=1 Tax=uncultured Amaricoccus sp. TaxID=339341 RepID=UPI00260AC7DA
TLALVEAVGYAQAYSFAYSPRPGTPAAGRPGVDPAESSDRLQRLQRLLDRQQRAFQQHLVGRTLPVLIEKPGRLPGQMAGRSPYLNAVHLAAGPELVGRIVPVRVVAAQANSLSGVAA